ncbi:MAG: hypothetical protein FD121_391 [Gallionellaceae bacterium]|nr:MAG: hypothetical protein FD121_391 [Gallionellaceae bacterium]
MRVLREFESHRLRQNNVLISLKKSAKPALRIAFAGFLLSKQYRPISLKLVLFVGKEYRFYQQVFYLPTSGGGHHGTNRA